MKILKITFTLRANINNSGYFNNIKKTAVLQILQYEDFFKPSSSSNYYIFLKTNNYTKFIE